MAREKLGAGRLDINRKKSEPETQSPRLTPWQLALLATVLFVVILAIDLRLPLGVAAGVPYVAVVLLGWWFPKLSQIIILAAISTALTLIGYYYSTEGNIQWMVHVNRFLALFAIWVSAVLLIAAKTATAALAKSEQRYMRLVENTPAGIWQITLDGETVFINDALARMFELDDPEEAVGRFYADFVTPDSAEKISNQLPKRQEGYTSQYEVEIVGKKGGKCQALLTGSPLFSPDGEMIGRIATLIDITGRKVAEAQVIQAAKLATLGEMATSVAHELNQPLNVVRMAAGNMMRKLEKGDAEPAYLKDKLERIADQTERAAAIIDHMRIFGRKADEKPHDVAPCDTINGALDLIGEQLRLAEIEVELECPKVCRPVLGHKVQMEQVVLNLLTNARDAIRGNSAKGGGKITVAVDDGGDDWVRITVCDSGGGIPEEAMSQIFEPFFTTKKMGEGTGLGLSVNYGIIHDMGGTIEAENIEGGARFTITLPVVEKDADNRGRETG